MINVFGAIPALLATCILAGPALAQDVRFIQLPTNASPRDLLFNPISNKLYTANTPQPGAPSSESVTIVNGATDTVIRTIEMGAGPRDFCLNTQSNRVYVANYFIDSVTVLDGVTNALVATVPVGDGPTALGHNPLGNTVYVSNVGAPGPNTPAVCSVSVIGGTTNTVVKTLTAGDEPTAFCHSPADRRMYWVNEWSHSLAVVDAETDTQVAVLPLGTGQVQPVDMAYNSLNGKVYTANRLTYAIGVLDTLPACVADLDGSGSVDGADLSLLISDWGGPLGDLDGDGQTGGPDLALMIASWGPC